MAGARASVAVASKREVSVQRVRVCVMSLLAMSGTCSNGVQMRRRARGFARVRWPCTAPEAKNFPHQMRPLTTFAAHPKTRHAIHQALNSRSHTLGDGALLRTGRRAHRTPSSPHLSCSHHHPLAQHGVGGGAPAAADAHQRALRLDVSSFSFGSLVKGEKEKKGDDPLCVSARRTRWLVRVRTATHARVPPAALHVH